MIDSLEEIRRCSRALKFQSDYDADSGIAAWHAGMAKTLADTADQLETDLCNADERAAIRQIAIDGLKAKITEVCAVLKNERSPLNERHQGFFTGRDIAAFLKGEADWHELAMAAIKEAR